jgi:hypothetical protein
MILLITPSARAQDCAQALHEATSETAHVAATLRQASAQLRSEEYSAVVVDQSLLEAEPDESDMVLQHLGTAIPVYVNFAISGIARVTRDLRVALRRRKREDLVARREAELGLRNELKGTVTALLLSCEMLLQIPDLSPAAESKMHALHQLAQDMRSKLGIVE